ncbi:MAG: transglutaminase domain-containing protein [Planctomycetota bacterium]|nr:transglutaminase domain-containing protein [Planctomycetota bacterium]
MTFLITCLMTALAMFQSSPAPEVMPQGALSREKPKLWWFSFDIRINTLASPNNDRPFRMPLIVQGSWSELLIKTLQVEARRNNTPTAVLAGEQSIKGRGPQGEQLVSSNVPLASNEHIRSSAFAIMSVSAELVSWNSVVNEDMAAATIWPAQWPSDVTQALQPQALIESDEPIFQETIKSLFGQNLRMTPPWLVAKALTQYTCNNIKISGSRTLRGSSGRVRGLNVQGALATATTGTGTRADLTCTCVAMLRAAGIPARPVVGISDRVKSGDELTTWAEFFLPGSGWVPFSPWQMQNGGVRSWKLNRPWRYFGNWNSLNEHVPFAWSFAPDDGSTVHDTWALWGWTRAIQGIDIPLPNPGPGTHGADINYAYVPSQCSTRLISGGSLGPQQLQEWKTGTARPLQRGNSRK